MRILCGIIACIMMHANMYFLPGKVQKITGEKVTVESHDGNLWEFYGDGYECGDAIILVMDNMNTAEIYDDEIVEVY